MAVTGPYRLTTPLACSTGSRTAVGVDSDSTEGALLMLCLPAPSARPLRGTLSRSCFDLPDPLVESPRHEHQQPDRGPLPDHLDPAELQPVAEHPDDQRADQRAEHQSAA